jgi:hypothetical protein
MDAAPPYFFFADTAGALAVTSSVPASAVIVAASCLVVGVPDSNVGGIGVFSRTGCSVMVLSLSTCANLYWLLQTSVRKIDSLVFHHPPILLRHVILNHGRVLPLSVVDNSAFSPTRLTPLSTLLILQRQGAVKAGGNAVLPTAECQKVELSCSLGLVIPHQTALGKTVTVQMRRRVGAAAARESL